MGAKFLLVLALAAFAASASPVLSSVSLFSQDAEQHLFVTLVNTSQEDVTEPSQVLTAVFFNLPAAESLVPLYARLGQGSTVLFGTAEAGGYLGGEWAYKCGLVGAPAGCIISSAGFGLVGPEDLFPGANLAGPESPDGLQYGITSAGDNPLVGNAKVTGSEPLIRNSVMFAFGSWTGNLETDKPTDIWYQYGTALTDPRTPQVPEPATFAAVGAGLLALRFLRRKAKT